VAYDGQRHRVSAVCVDTSGELPGIRVNRHGSPALCPLALFGGVGRRGPKSRHPREIPLVPVAISSQTVTYDGTATGVALPH